MGAARKKIEDQRVIPYISDSKYLAIYKQTRKNADKRGIEFDFSESDFWQIVERAHGDQNKSEFQKIKNGHKLAIEQNTKS